MDNHNAQTQTQILASNDRLAVIAWLVWNDANGVYKDSDSKLEGWEPMTLSEAKSLMLDILSR